MKFCVKARSDLYAFAVMGLLFAFAYRNLFNIGMLAYGDNPPFFNSSTDAFKSFFYRWGPLALGSSFPSLQLDLVQSILISVLGENSIVAQKIFVLSVLPSAFLFMYLLVGRVTSNTFARLVSGLVYAINPVTLGEFIGGTINSVLAGYALFPLAMFFLFRFLDGEKRSRSIVPLSFSIALAMSFAWDIAIEIVLCVFVFTCLHLVSGAANREERTNKVLLTSVSLGIAVLLTFLLTFYWSFNLLGYVPFTHNTGEQAITNNVAGFLENIKGSYPNASLLNTLKLGGILCNLGYCAGFSRLTWIGYVLPLISFSGLLWVKDVRSQSKYWLGFASIAIVILGFIELTRHETTFILFRSFPFLGVFRNPGKLLLILAFAYSGLIAIAMEKIFINLSKIPALSIIATFSFIVAWTTYAWPFFTGDMGLAMTRGTDHYVIPKAYSEATQWIKVYGEDDPAYRTLWLPMDYEELEIKTRWLQPNQFSAPLGMNQFFNVPANHLMDMFQDAFASGNTALAIDILRLGGVRYIVVNLKSSQTEEIYKDVWFLTPYLKGDPQNFILSFEREKAFKKLEQNKDFVIYEVIY